MKFSSIIGQAETIQRLRENVNTGRISHAQLFSGAEGSGNLALALAYANYIMCTARSAEDSCGTCPACHKFSKLIHPDLHFVFPVASIKNVTAPVSDDFVDGFRQLILQNPYAGYMDWQNAIGIENKQALINKDQGNEIIRKLSLRSFESKYKMMLIWFPEKMNHQAANKLLKILEEPPENTLFLLVTEKPDELLITILSRTQKVFVPPVKEEDIQFALINKHGVNPGHAESLAKLSEGNYNRALKLIDIDEAESAIQEQFRIWMKLCSDPSLQYKLIAWAEEYSQTGRENLKTFLQYASSGIRQLLLCYLQTGGLLRETEEEKNFNASFKNFVHPGNCEQLLKIISQCSYEVERNGNTKLVMLDASFRISRSLMEKSTQAV